VRVLITRPREDADPLALRLDGLGIGSLIEPLLTIRALDVPAPDLTSIQAILATSANGIRAFARLVGDRSVPVLAVGDGTARTARDLGFARIESAEGDVQSLAGLVASSLRPADGALLHVAGTVTAGDLGGRLAAAGFDYRRVQLYAADTANALSATTARALREGWLDAVLLFSPRTGRTFARLVEKAGLAWSLAVVRALCLSGAVAEAVRGLPWERVVVASRPDQDSLLAVLMSPAA
jgi:uroporphyrinogen-III synthase